MGSLDFDDLGPMAANCMLRKGPASQAVKSITEFLPDGFWDVSAMAPPCAKGFCFDYISLEPKIEVQRIFGLTQIRGSFRLALLLAGRGQNCLGNCLDSQNC